MKIALAMITKGDEGESLDRCLSSVNKWVDKVYLTVTTEGDSAAEVGRKYGADVVEVPGKFHREITKEEIDWLRDFQGWEPFLKEGTKIFEFQKARNFSFNRVSEEYDYILWLDSDDIFRGGDKIKEVLKIAEENNIDGFFFNYLYKVEADDKGFIKNIIIQHKRERIVRRGVYKWEAPIHETLIPQREVRQVDSPICDVVHLSNDGKMENNLMRNMLALEMSIVDCKASDPRPIYYLGKSLYDYAKIYGDRSYFDKAKALFFIYLKGDEVFPGTQKSGWEEERAQCWEYIGEIERELGDLESSLKAGFSSLRESPKFRSTYLAIAMTYTQKNDWDKAMHWLQIATGIKEAHSTLVGNPKDEETRAHEIAYHFGLNNNNLNMAVESAKALAQLKPEDPTMKQRLEFTARMLKQREMTRIFTSMAQELSRNGESHKLKSLVMSAPKEIANNPFVENLRKQVSPPKTWKKDEITMWCGPGFAAWSPLSIENPEGSFIGGSEEAVIYLCKELADLGWKVTVYGDPGDDEGEYDGVTYLPYYKFNAADNFNIMISWRQVGFVDGNYNCKKMYVWNHDIQNPLEYTDERLEKIDKVFVLSPWHRENIKNVPDDKVVISANGMTL